MNPGISLQRAFRSRKRRFIDFLSRKLKRKFYLYLAVVLSGFAVVDVIFLHQIVEMREKSFDMMAKYRFLKPRPDPEIIIVDINEASLAAMSNDYGRWPWPRQVFGEFVEKIEPQKPKAIVFDILFSDPDVFNPDSDAYFNDVIASTTNIFFPVLRLAKEHDALSQIKPENVPGMKPVPDTSIEDKTIALVLPYFPAAISHGKLGTHNIYPDNDGIVRNYRLFHDDYGWTLPSLPLAIAQTLGYNPPDTKNILLNWRGGPFTYATVSFSDVYGDMLKKNKTRSPNEFTDKIVIIGSTAPSLFDVKATSMAKLHPGVEILATAIDNVKHSDYLHVPKNWLPYLLVGLAILWATAYGFYRNLDQDKLAGIYGLSQVGLLAVSYGSMNLSSFYINLSGPVTLGFIYFSVAKIYNLATSKALDTSIVAETQRDTITHGVTLAVFQIRGASGPANAGILRKISKLIRHTGEKTKDVEFIHGPQYGAWILLEGTIVVTWAYDVNDDARREQIESEIDKIKVAIKEYLTKSGTDEEHLCAFAWNESTVDADGVKLSDTEWKLLLAQTLMTAFADMETKTSE